MKSRKSIVGIFAVATALSAMAYAEPAAPAPPAAPNSKLASGRTVYLGTLQEQTGWIFGYNALDDQIVYQSIQWASGKPAGPYTVLILDSLETGSWGLFPAWINFMARHPDVTVTWTEADPIPLSFYETGAYDVLLIGNAWHGDPAEVPPPSPGGKSWVFTDQELEDIKTYVGAGHGLIVTGGSFGQFSRDTTLGYNNYKLASFMCLESTGGGDPAHADALPWSRNTSYYPPIRPPAPTTIFLYNDAPTHPIMAGIPASYAVSPNNAMAQWMSLAEGKGSDGVVLAHYGVGVDHYHDSMNVACEHGKKGHGQGK